MMTDQPQIALASNNVIGFDAWRHRIKPKNRRATDGSNKNPNLFNALQAVNAFTPQTPHDAVTHYWQELYFNLRSSVKEMRMLQKNRERSPEPRLWEMAASLEHLVDDLMDHPPGSNSPRSPNNNPPQPA